MFDFETCPGCGRSPDGQTHHGADKPNGSRETVCWKCERMYRQTAKRYFDSHTATAALLNVLRATLTKGDPT